MPDAVTGPFISYAQNAEDVVLWRAVRDIRNGTFVDVGSADPIADSVTFALYQRGWRGVHVEPVPALADALRTVRPNDQTFQVAAGRAAGSTQLFVTPGTGRSTVKQEVAAATAAEGHGVEPITVDVLTLDEILSLAGMDGRPIHICKIDVEGAEADALAGFDLVRWRPWILVVEATQPQSTNASHGEWEEVVRSAGYSFTLFDGLNRFYVAEGHGDLVAPLSYPACVFDQPYVRADVATRLAELRDEAAACATARDEAAARRDALQDCLERVQSSLSSATLALADTRRDAIAWRTAAVADLERASTLEGCVRELEQRQHDLHRIVAERDRQLAAVEATVSWRVTRPLRAVRRRQLRPRDDLERATSGPEPASPVEEFVPDLPAGPTSRWLMERLSAATDLLSEHGSARPTSVGDALLRFEQAIAASSEPPSALAWLSFVTVLGRYPTDVELDRAARGLRTGGSGSLLMELRSQLAELAARDRVERGLHVLRESVVVDVSHTVSVDLHTGIQRVVREMIGRWIIDHDVALLYFDRDEFYPTLLEASEVRRLVAWKDYAHASGAAALYRRPAQRSNDVLVPWRCQLVVPELAAERDRCEAYRPLARAEVLSGLGIIGYDLIPTTASETVTEGMAANFANYLTVVKYATRLSAISQASAIDFAAFGAMLASQGLTGPVVAAHPLPAERPARIAADVDQLGQSLRLGSMPLVLVVGSHEPRKNHLLILEAAERLWQQGGYFHLLMIGGSAWRDDEFNGVVAGLQAKGRPIKVWRRPSEPELWAAYHLARFSVFPSLIEGYGLPIAESLSCGTPVVASNYGSMAEVAEGGGTLVVDPRDVDALFEAMSRLLDDDGLVRRLEQEANDRHWASWDDYARDVWRHLVPTST